MLSIMKTWLAIMFEFVITVGLADFVAGFVHWFEDACVREDTPLIGAAVGRPGKTIACRARAKPAC
jgi:hypothetical protein